jgi:putative aldouronate transport system substrate-binding protein
VTNQVSACLTVNNTYYKALQTGALDPDESLSKVVDELNAAGLQDILAEEQKQVDSFIASK